MYTVEQLTNIYAAAYFNETGTRLTERQKEYIEFTSFKLTYESEIDRTTILIFDFDDNDSFPGPDLVTLINTRGQGWELA
jgi:hypothetical protein